MEHASYGWAKRALDMGDKPTLHVVIIYQNRTAGYRAKDFYERTVSAFDGACDFRLDLWNFQVLAMPHINKTAAKAAALADLVILSMCRKCQLPPKSRIGSKGGPVLLQIAILQWPHWLRIMNRTVAKQLGRCPI